MVTHYFPNVLRNCMKRQENLEPLRQLTDIDTLMES